MWLLAAALMLTSGHGQGPKAVRSVRSTPTPSSSWGPSQCALSTASPSVWFADVGETVLQQDSVPATRCGTELRLSGARGEHVTFQIAVHSATVVTKGVEVALTTTSDLGPLAVQRAVYTRVTTAANNLTSRGVGMYPDPLPFPNDTVRFPQGGGEVKAGEVATFWLTLGPIPPTTAAGVHTARLSVGGTAVQNVVVDIRVWDFTLPDAAHASQSSSN